jgi:phage baseplate assembly protein W
MADLFVSYSRTDARFVEKVSGQLRAAGISVWVDTEGIDGGDRWRTAITQAINGCRWCMLVVSPRSMASPQVAREVNLAFDKGRPIVPVVYETTDIAEGLEYALAGLQHVDFTIGTFEDGVTKLHQALGIAGHARTMRSSELTLDEADSATVGRGLAFPLRVDGRGAIAMAGEGAAIDDSIRMILTTQPGARLGHRELGCNLLDFAFARLDDATRREISDRIREALEAWEPRALDIVAQVAPSARRNDLELTIGYLVRGSSERRELVARVSQA